MRTVFFVYAGMRKEEDFEKIYQIKIKMLIKTLDFKNKCSYNMTYKRTFVCFFVSDTGFIYTAFMEPEKCG